MNLLQKQADANLSRPLTEFSDGSGPSMSMPPLSKYSLKSGSSPFR